jgi:transmembrane sensor
MTSKRTLPVPLEHLVDHSAPAQAGELWRDLAARRLARQRRRGPSARVLLSLAACFVMLLGSALALTLGFRLPGREDRPLLVADRSALPAQIDAPGAYRAIDLSDGSRVTLAEGAHLDVLETSPRTVSFALRAGRVRFDVRPRGPRSWRIECGAFSVEVVGTKFVLERSQQDVSVEVLHGAVLVRGAAIPDGVQRLEAGRSLRARLPSMELAEAPAAARSAPVVLPFRGAVSVAPAEQAGAAVAEQGSPLPVSKAARRGRAVPSQRDGEVDALFRAADTARLRGRAPEAAAKLSRILEHHADDPRASLAGFALARLQLGALGQPDLAAENLKLALSLGLPRALLEDAYGKLAEAYEKAGDKSAACLAFSEYSRRFPHGEKASRPPQQCQVDNAQ